MRWAAMMVGVCLLPAVGIGCSGGDRERAEPAEARAGLEAPGVALDRAAVDRYLAYQHACLDAAGRAVRRWEAVKARRGAREVSRRERALAVSRIRAWMEREEAALRRALGLSPPVLHEVEALALQVLVGQAISVNGETDRMLQALRTALTDPSLPASDRSEVRVELQRVVDELERARSFADARERYGDEAVEAVVARADELAHLRSALLETRARLR